MFQLLCQESWWRQLSPQLQLTWKTCIGRPLLAFPRGPCPLILRHLALFNVLWRPTSSSFIELYDGSYRVVAKSSKVFKLQFGSCMESVLVDRLKPCLSSEVILAVPPQRSRPPLPPESQPLASILGGPL